MDLKKLQTLVVKALEDVKAQDVVMFDTTHLTSLFDRVVIASGTSNRHTKALASSVRDKVKEAGGHVAGIEGDGTGEWVLVDLGDIIVHVMQPVIRAYYRLEEIWGDKAVKITTTQRKRAVTSNMAEEAPPKKPRAAPKKATTKTTTGETAPKKATRATAKTAVKTPVKRARTTRPKKD